MHIATFVVGPLATNCYIVAVGGECVVVDPDGGGPTIEAELGRLGLSPGAIVLTHGHVDHALGSGTLARALGVPLMAHPLDAPYLQAAGQDAWVVGEEGAGPVIADADLADGQVIPLGGDELTVLHTPGHSPGSVCLLGRAGLLSGDLLFRSGFGRTDLPGGSWRELCHSVRAVVFSLPPETPVYPGHGPSTTVGDELAFWDSQGLLGEGATG
jgi:glyoxylase-like metal-dependent hydrolase (beta-lactamase superfamily II)